MAARLPRSGAEDEPDYTGSGSKEVRAGHRPADAAGRTQGEPADADEPILWPIGLRIAFIAGISVLLWSIVVGLILIILR